MSNEANWHHWVTLTSLHTILAVIHTKKVCECSKICTLDSHFLIGLVSSTKLNFQCFLILSKKQIKKMKARLVFPKSQQFNVLLL